MKGTFIYELAIIPVGTLNTIRQREPSVFYFSNLQKTIDCLVNVLALNGWPPLINYTAAYRNLRGRNRYSRDFEIGSNKVFKVVITRHPLNPALTTLAIEEMPYVKYSGK